MAPCRPAWPRRPPLDRRREKTTAAAHGGHGVVPPDPRTPTARGQGRPRRSEKPPRPLITHTSARASQSLSAQRQRQQRNVAHEARAEAPLRRPQAPRACARRRTGRRSASRPRRRSRAGKHPRPQWTQRAQARPGATRALRDHSADQQDLPGPGELLHRLRQQQPVGPGRQLYASLRARFRPAEGARTPGTDSHSDRPPLRDRAHEHRDHQVPIGVDLAPEEHPLGRRTRGSTRQDASGYRKSRPGEAPLPLRDETDVSAEQGRGRLLASRPPWCQ